jgi:hypothetical protein
LLRIFRTYIPLPYKNRFLEKEKSMRNVILISTFIVLLVFIESPFCMASALTINPSDDGRASINGFVNTFDYVTCSWDNRGIIEFPLNSIDGQIEAATLTVNPYGLPLWGNPVQVYGYSSTDGILTVSDYDAGVFLGNWTLPNLNHGQDAYFDVTSFLKTVTTPYVGFNLRSDGTDVFSSLEYNYGHPSQLLVSVIPEPATIFLLGLGAAILRKKR